MFTVDDLQPSIERLYPDGTIGPGTGIYAGQCAKFCSTIFAIGGIGNLLKDKIATVNNRGIPVAKLNGDFRVGDVVITKDNLTYGHAFMLERKKTQLSGYAAESNWYGDGRVHYNRLVNLAGPNIIGVLRASILIPIINKTTLNYMPLFFVFKGTVYADVEGKLQGLAMNEQQLQAEYPGCQIVPLTDAQFNSMKGSWVMAPSSGKTAAPLQAGPLLKLSASQLRRLAITAGKGKK